MMNVPVIATAWFKGHIEYRNLFRCHRRKITLANKEFQMMEMMMSNPKNIISTEHFMDRIWGYDSESEINVVWAYISYLRRKLQTIGSRVELKALRGRGYILEEKTS